MDPEKWILKVDPGKVDPGKSGPEGFSYSGDLQMPTNGSSGSGTDLNPGKSGSWKKWILKKWILIKWTLGKVDRGTSVPRMSECEKRNAEGAMGVPGGGASGDPPAVRSASAPMLRPRSRSARRRRGSFFS